MKINIILLIIIIVISFLILPKRDSTEKVSEEASTEVNENLILVNKFNSINKEYKPNDLILAKSPSLRDVYLRSEPLEYYELFLEICPYDFHLFSGYRSYELQAELYEDSNYNNDLVAKPGESEHQTGLALDISLPEIGLTEKLGDHKSGIYLKNNIHKFGFIIRYEDGKKHLTGYDYEPWHIRYVGVEHSTYIFENNLTLEEYLK